MNIIKERALIAELNQKINEYCNKYLLFCGGCCYSAYVLSKYLTLLGVHHKIAIFQDHDILNETNFNKAINGRGVAHVAIQVRHKCRKMYIGDCTGLFKYFESTGEPFKIRTYPSVNPKELLDAYNHNDWNWTYDPVHNQALHKAIKKIYLKFAEI